MKAILALFTLLLLTAPALARDGYGDRPLVCDPQEFAGDSAGLKKCTDWISGVRQPHVGQTCCGEGDAYIADEWDQDKDGGWVAVITRDYPPTVMLPGVPKGTRISIPANRMDDEHQGNPTGHGIVFFNWNGDAVNVLCFFTNSLM